LGPHDETEIAGPFRRGVEGAVAFEVLETIAELTELSIRRLVVAPSQSSRSRRLRSRPSAGAAPRREDGVHSERQQREGAEDKRSLEPLADSEQQDQQRTTRKQERATPPGGSSCPRLPAAPRRSRPEDEPRVAVWASWRPFGFHAAYAERPSDAIEPRSRWSRVWDLSHEPAQPAAETPVPIRPGGSLPSRPESRPPPQLCGKVVLPASSTVDPCHVRKVTTSCGIHRGGPCRAGPAGR
jgi:hypothetical protein